MTEKEEKRLRAKCDKWRKKIEAQCEGAFHTISLDAPVEEAVIDNKRKVFSPNFLHALTPVLMLMNRTLSHILRSTMLLEGKTGVEKQIKIIEKFMFAHNKINQEIVEEIRNNVSPLNYKEVCYLVREEPEEE